MRPALSVAPGNGIGRERALLLPSSRPLFRNYRHLRLIRLVPLLPGESDPRRSLVVVPVADAMTVRLTAGDLVIPRPRAVNGANTHAHVSPSVLLRLCATRRPPSSTKSKGGGLPGSSCN